MKEFEVVENIIVKKEYSVLKLGDYVWGCNPHNHLLDSSSGYVFYIDEEKEHVYYSPDVRELAYTDVSFDNIKGKPYQYMRYHFPDWRIFQRGIRSVRKYKNRDGAPKTMDQFYVDIFLEVYNETK